MGNFTHAIIFSNICFSTERVNLNYEIPGEIQQLEVEWDKVSSDGRMLDGWTARDEQPIHRTSTHPCIKGTAGTQRVKELIQHHLFRSPLLFTYIVVSLN
jgi:hypothetical protein